MHSVLGRNILFGCQRYGIKVLDYFNMEHFSFRDFSFRKLCTVVYASRSNIDEDWVINLLNECILLRDQQLSHSGLDISQLNYIISHLCCS